MNDLNLTITPGSHLKGRNHALRVSLTDGAHEAALRAGLHAEYVSRTYVSLFDLERVISAGLGWGVGSVRQAPAGAEILLGDRLRVALAQPRPGKAKATRGA